MELREEEEQLTKQLQDISIEDKPKDFDADEASERLNDVSAACSGTISCLALLCPALPCPALACVDLPCPALPCPCLSCLALPCLTLPCLALTLTRAVSLSITCRSCIVHLTKLLDMSLIALQALHVLILRLLCFCESSTSVMSTLQPALMSCSAASVS